MKPYYQDEWVTIYLGDCRDILPELPKVDLVLTDPPYGMTQNEWDCEVGDIWKYLIPVTADEGCVVLTSLQPFTSKLVMSNLNWFKWEQIWYKTRSTGHLNCKVMPMRQHENILIFAPNRTPYYPIITKKPLDKIKTGFSISPNTGSYGKFNPAKERTIEKDESYPRSVIVVGNTNLKEWGLHPTQKPEELFEYLIATYSNPNARIIDPFLGSGTTTWCAKKLGRHCIGIEIEEKYCEIAANRCRQTVMNLEIPKEKIEQGSLIK